MANNLRSIRASVAVAVALTSVLASAADESFSPAAICNWNSGLAVGSQGQLTNSGAAVASAFCGVGQEQATDANDDAVVFYNDATTTGALFCGVVENTADWSAIVFGDQKFACSTVGGCSAPPPNSFTGTGSIRLADIAHGGSMISTVTCNIPGGGSQVRAITLDEQ